MTRRPLYPEAIERGYARRLVARAGLLHRAAVAALARRHGSLPGRADADAEPAVVDVARALVVLARLRETFAETFAPRIEEIRRIAAQLDLFATRQVRSAVEGAGGSVPRVGINAPRPLIDRWVRENVDLIVTIDRRFFDDLEGVIREAHARGVNVRDLSRMIRERYRVAQSNAIRIARDQAGKLNGQITEKRHRDLGIASYRWSTSRDERVRGRPGGKYPDARPSHWHREGEEFAWAVPPSDGHPGYAIQCRCVAIPVLPPALTGKIAK